MQSRSRFTRRPDSMRGQQPKCRPTCANASCGPLWHAVTSKRMTPRTWQATPTAVAFRSMPGCASRQQTAQGWSACCATVRGHPSLVDRLKQRGADLVYRCGKGHSEPLQSDKYPGELVLTPLELIERHRSVGAATAHTPPPLLRRAGTQLAIAGGRDGDGSGRTGVDARRAQSRDTECMHRCRYDRRSRRLWCIWCSGPA